MKIEAEDKETFPLALSKECRRKFFTLFLINKNTTTKFSQLGWVSNWKSLTYVSTSLIIAILTLIFFHSFTFYISFSSMLCPFFMWSHDWTHFRFVNIKKKLFIIIPWRHSPRKPNENFRNLLSFFGVGKRRKNNKFMTIIFSYSWEMYLFLISPNYLNQKCEFINNLSCLLKLILEDEKEILNKNGFEKVSIFNFLKIFVNWIDWNMLSDHIIMNLKAQFIHFA